MSPSASFGAPFGAVDARGDRAVQGAVGLVLLTAFVFGWVWVVPIVALILAPGALLGPRANVAHLAFDRLVLPRLAPADATVAEKTVQSQDSLLAAALGVAFVLLFIGLAPVGWLLALAAAVVAAIAATSGFHVGDQVRWLRR